FPKGAADFLAHDDPPESRGDDGVAFDVAEFISQPPANIGRDVCMLEKQRTLEELPAMQTGAQDEMTVEERPGPAEKREQILAHLLEIAEVSQEHGRLHDVRERQLLRFQDRRYAVEHAPGLLRDVFRNDLAGLRVERDLPGAKDERTGPDRLGIRPDRRWRVGGGNDLLHPASLAGKRRDTTNDTA